MKLPAEWQIVQCQERTPWAFGDSVLYGLCADHFDHKDDEKILAKVWLIGRSYSVAIERRRNKKQNSDDFYTQIAVPAIRKLSLDEQLSALRRYERVTPESAVEVLKVHNCLTQGLQKITGLEKRSFSSKYLHFHLPELFFIYDYRALTGLRAFISRVPDDLQHISDTKEADTEYAKFTCKCLELKR